MHTFVPQTQVTALVEAPSVLEQDEMVEEEHWLNALWQKRPVVGVHSFVPHTHVSELAKDPSAVEQAEMAEDEHWLYVLLQKRPVVDVQTATPQMHPALLAVVPSVSKQSGPVTLMQGMLEKHVVVEVVRVLK